MSVLSNVIDGTLTIEVMGSFDLSIYDEFHKSYPSDLSEIRAVVIDLSHADYIDSTAIGMILSLRQAMGGENANISLLNPNENVARLLEVAQLKQLMVIKSE